MLSFQKYIFTGTARTLLVIIATLAVLALLAQGLTYSDIIQENHQSIFIYAKIIGLGAPRVLALLTPLALFVACLWTLNRIHRDAEISVVQATGMTHWQVASPVLRLAMLLVLVHLGLNLWVQPAAQQELRASLSEARTDLATSLIRPGEFIAADALTFYVKGRKGSDISSVFISDARDQLQTIDYLAQTGRITSRDGKPALILETVQIHQKDEFGELSILNLDQYKYDLTALTQEETDTVYKASDRYLPGLIWLDPTNYIDARSRNEFTAEIYYRLTSPLLNIAMVLLALWAILGGDYNKLGYSRRISIASIYAVLLILLHIVAQSEAKSAPALNHLQWLLPVGAIGCLSVFHFSNIKSRFSASTSGGIQTRSAKSGVSSS